MVENVDRSNIEIQNMEEEKEQKKNQTVFMDASNANLNDNMVLIDEETIFSNEEMTLPFSTDITGGFDYSVQSTEDLSKTIGNRIPFTSSPLKQNLNIGSRENSREILNEKCISPLLKSETAIFTAPSAVTFPANRSLLGMESSLLNSRKVIKENVAVHRKQRQDFIQPYPRNFLHVKQSNNDPIERHLSNTARRILETLQKSFPPELPSSTYASRSYIIPMNSSSVNEILSPKFARYSLHSCSESEVQASNLAQSMKVKRTLFHKETAVEERIQNFIKYSIYEFSNPLDIPIPSELDLLQIDCSESAEVSFILACPCSAEKISSISTNSFKHISTGYTATDSELSPKKIEAASPCEERIDEDDQSSECSCSCSDKEIREDTTDGESDSCEECAAIAEDKPNKSSSKESLKSLDQLSSLSTSEISPWNSSPVIPGLLASDQWECQGCYVRNNYSINVCPCCQTERVTRKASQSSLPRVAVTSTVSSQPNGGFLFPAFNSVTSITTTSTGSEYFAVYSKAGSNGVAVTSTVSSQPNGGFWFPAFNSVTSITTNSTGSKYFAVCSKAGSNGVAVTSTVSSQPNGGFLFPAFNSVTSITTTSTGSEYFAVYSKAGSNGDKVPTNKAINSPFRFCLPVSTAGNSSVSQQSNSSVSCSGVVAIPPNTNFRFMLPVQKDTLAQTEERQPTSSDLFTFAFNSLPVSTNSTTAVASSVFSSTVVQSSPQSWTFGSGFDQRISTKTSNPFSNLSQTNFQTSGNFGFPSNAFSGFRDEASSITPEENVQINPPINCGISCTGWNPTPSLLSSSSVIPLQQPTASIHPAFSVTPTYQFGQGSAANSSVFVFTGNQNNSCSNILPSAHPLSPSSTLNYLQDNINPFEVQSCRQNQNSSRLFKNKRSRNRQ